MSRRGTGPVPAGVGLYYGPASYAARMSDLAVGRGATYEVSAVGEGVQRVQVS